MKKLAKFFALLLAGVLMFSMTACSSDGGIGGGSVGGSAFDEDAARKVILEEINACRAEYNKEQLTEYPQLDAHAAAYLKQYQEKNTTILKKSETEGEEVTRYWKVAEAELGADYWYGIGRESVNSGSEETSYRLVGKYGSREMVREQIRMSNEVKKWQGNGVGIAFATINGELYWYATAAKLNK